MDEEYISLVESVSVVHGPPVGRAFIVLALEQIEQGKEKVRFYPTGKPVMKDVYQLATRLEKEASIIQ